jgi:hypothetical protein
MPGSSESHGWNRCQLRLHGNYLLRSTWIRMHHRTRMQRSLQVSPASSLRHLEPKTATKVPATPLNVPSSALTPNLVICHVRLLAVFPTQYFVSIHGSGNLLLHVSGNGCHVVISQLPFSLMLTSVIAPGRSFGIASTSRDSRVTKWIFDHVQSKPSLYIQLADQDK